MVKKSALSVEFNLPQELSDKVNIKQEEIVVTYELDDHGSPIFGKWMKKNQWIRQQKLEKIINKENE